MKSFQTYEELPQDGNLYIYGNQDIGHHVKLWLSSIAQGGVPDRFKGFIDTMNSCHREGAICYSLPDYLAHRRPDDVILVAARRKESILAGLRERLDHLDRVYDCSALYAARSPARPVEEVIEAVAKQAGRDAVCLDIGANVGETALLMAQHCAMVHAFEPNPDLEPEFAGRTAGTANIERHAMAVSDYRGETFLNLRGHHTQHFVSGLGPVDDRSVRVPVTTIDQFCMERGMTPSFIKIDVEGTEPHVIRGAMETIRRHRPVIIFEFHERHWWFGYEAVFTALHGMYRISRCEDGLDAWSYYNLQRGGPEMYNMLCMPQS